MSTNLIPCWTVVDQAGGFGSWCIQTGATLPQGTCAGSSASVAAPPEGLQAAMTNQSGPGSSVLYRCDTLSTGGVSFKLYLNNENGAFYSPSTLDYTFSPNQQFRADLVTPAGIAANPFTLAPGDILANLYQTLPGNPAVSGYVTVNTGVPGLIGQTVCLRFAVAGNQYYFHAGVDNVQFNASPPPTPTPGPTPGPTPTPCLTACGVDFSIGTNLLSGAGGACDSSGTSTNVCNVPLGAKFNVNVYLNSLPATLVDGYAGYQATLDYTGLTATETQQSMHLDYWPDCGFPFPSFSPGTVVAICVTGVGDPSSTYTGRMVAPEFTCTAAGAITLVHGLGQTEIIDDSFNEFWEDSDESLTINCVAPQAYPGDTDGDGCPDTKEEQTAVGSELSGGRRSFLNPWDYFNPSHDGTNGVDDILMVVAHFGKNEGDLGYSVDYDRTGLGPNPWNLGPPDGKIRVADILAIVAQFGHDCA